MTVIGNYKALQIAGDEFTMKHLVMSEDWQLTARSFLCQVFKLVKRVWAVQWLRMLNLRSSSKRLRNIAKQEIPGQ